VERDGVSRVYLKTGWTSEMPGPDGNPTYAITDAMQYYPPTNHGLFVYGSYEDSPRISDGIDVSVVTVYRGKGNQKYTVREVADYVSKKLFPGLEIDVSHLPEGGASSISSPCLQ
jgi:hypothetical protein